MDFERLNGDIKEMRRRNRGLALTVGLLAAAHVLVRVISGSVAGFRPVRVGPCVAMRVGRLQAHYRSEGTRQKAISTRRLRARPSGVSFSVA